MSAPSNVEARSLSTLNQLAANPPQYPTKPSEGKQEPLILYISRVPGTRDVILSPFKPQLKNVTGEDVTNSLYYIHLNSPDDVLEAPAPIDDPERPRTSQESARSLNQIPRKPLPASSKALPRAPPPAVEGEMAAPPTSRTPSESPPPYPEPPRVHVSDCVPPRLPPRPSSIQLESYGYETPPDLPPRPTSQGHHGHGGFGSAGPTGPRAFPAVRFAEPNAHVNRSDPRFDRQLENQRPTSSHSAQHVLPSSMPSATLDKYTPYVPFSLTVIRRDPSSGHQWNVGRVTSHQIETEEESGYMHVRRACDDSPEPAPINITIETSGYCKFRDMPSRQSIDSHVRPASSRPGTAGPATFSRQAVMTYTKGWRSNIREKLRRRSEASEGPRPNPRIMHSREHSSDSFDDDAEAPLITQPGPGLRARGYVFSSPWDGRCVFRTGNAGRSVVCRHIMPGAAQSHLNPLVPSSGDQRRAAVGLHPVASELRFNLPVTDLLKSKEEAAQHIQDNLNRFLRPKHRGGGGGHGYSSEEEYYGVTPFDLSLGKEKAGGGRRGRRAKLGKLIIYEEGLKMLDLIVAANMGVWWGAWEKSFV